MVLGLRSKNKKGASVHVDYIINIQVIKPWPPSQSLRSIRCVVLQWENGDRKSGFTNPVVPSLGSGIGDGKIEFNEPFKLQVTFLKEAPMKGNDPGTFQKNLLELNLYEPRRDKTLKGQHLGSAVIDLAEHGVIKEAVSVGVPVNCKRSFRNTAQPVLYVKIQPNNRDSASSSSRESLSKEVSLDKDGRESVSALMNEEYAEEAEFASLTDDDGSSYSSLTNSSSAFEANADLQSQNSPREPLDRENISESRKESKGVSNVETDLHLESVPVKSEVKPATEAYVPNGAAIHQNGSPCQSSSLDLSIGPGSLDDGDASVSNSPQREFTLNMEKLDKPSTNSVSASVTYKGMEDEIRSSKNMDGVERDDLFQEVHAKVVDCRGAETIVGDPLKKENYINGSVETFESSEVVLQKEKLNLLSTTKPEHNVDEDGMSRDNKNGSMDLASSNGVHEIFMEKKCEEQIINGSDGKIEELQNHSLVIERLMDSRDNLTMASVASVDHIPVNQQHRILQSDLREPVTADRPVPSQRVLGEKGNSTLFRDRPHSMKFSFGLPPDSMGNMTLVTNNQIVEDVKEIDFLEDVRNSGVNFVTDEGIDDQETTSSSSDKVKHVSRDKRKGFSYNKVRELELRVHMLEGELREAAAIEIGLYSVVAEHGSSMHKVHTPARRLSRLYIHASKQWSQERRGSTARSAVSGLILAAKACGNDVPRLTFWLTNLVVLRAIVTQAARHSDTEANGAGMAAKRKTSPLKWKSTLTKKIKFPFTEELDDWEDPHTFTAALEKIESWTFSRIIESIWWQTFTPHMQSTNEDDDEPKKSLHSKKSNGRKPSLDAQEQANISIKIWKKALKDACERLCPVRAGGHDCGCLPMLARLVMEQCVARLDVAMFNAILRESDDEIPTDPVSDPIGDSRVLPVPSGKSSFGAGAQLKNAIGNWSRWLTDLFGIDADDSAQDENEQDDDRLDVAASFKSFHLLNALSDLLMLPKDMLLESSIRKEVCPAFSALMIKRILNSFEPDEFYPDPIPDRVLEALDSEDPLEKSEEKIRNLPCNASPIVYSPPSMASIENIVGDIRNRSLLRSGSSVLRKCHTSDDELDELDSPLASIFIDRSPTPTAKSKGISSENTVRYQLLREVWRDGD